MLYDPLEDGLSQQVRLKNGAIALIRPLVGAADIAACEQLQTEIWGDGPHSGLIAHSVLGVIPSVGGLVVGAFVDDVLQACLISFPGFSKAAQPIHWSARLAVTPGYRDSGLGYEMKRYQRLACRDMHVTQICWTYDPLESRNAHFNLNKLGVEIHAYKRDVYGLSESPLHRGIGTDRFLVCWSLNAPRKPLAVDLQKTPLFSETEMVDSPHYKIVIPDNIQRIKEQEPEEALSHRQRTRSLFESAFALGLTVVGFQRDRDSGASYYLLGGRS